MTDNSVPNGGSTHPATAGSVNTSVLERARNGDQIAFERIFSLYAGLVYHWCRKSGLDEGDAYNVSQEVFLSVSRGLHNFKREKSGDSFRGWLRTIARTRIADYYRQKPKDNACGGEDNWLHQVKDPCASESFDDFENETLLVYERAIRLIENEFSEQDCSAFKLLVMEGLNAKEVASKVGITVNSVYIAKSRILKRVRAEFEDVMDLAIGGEN